MTAQPDPMHGSETEMAHTSGRLVEPSSLADGRHRRGARSRAAIVDALLDLVREGNPNPSSAQIASRAGVTQRTLFNQFGDMGALLAKLVERQAPRVAELMPSVDPGSFDERLHQFCSGCSVLLEDTSPVRWALLSNPATSDMATAIVSSVAGLLRASIEASFADELDRFDPPEQDAVIDAIVIACDPITWRVRRVHHHQDLDRATRDLALTLRGLLASC